MKMSIYQCNTQFVGKQENVIYFTFVVVYYYLIRFEYVSLWNLIKLVNILRKHAARKQKRF